MSQTYGIEAHKGPPAVHQGNEQPPARYLVMIGGDEGRVAKLFLENRQLVAEFDAASEEATQLVAGLQPNERADRADWDTALAGYDAAERASASVYVLEV